MEVAVCVCADEKPGEENHSDDEYDTSHDAYPRQDLIQSIRPLISVVAVARRLNNPRCPELSFCVRFGCVGHVAIVAMTSVPTVGHLAINFPLLAALYSLVSLAVYESSGNFNLSGQPAGSSRQDPTG